MNDDCPVRLLDDIGQNAQSGGYGSVSIAEVDINVRAVVPFDVRRVECVLDLDIAVDVNMRH
jgi:hypothetical protein